ncbi:unnamed protein product [Allacma fusca]|uniref:CRAL-TRIO domain-containing protein n=1 Tax=Allacma fusca TaxID=39272 RepID=A0A8J2JZF1_9HEXA|nr:unnamed protein product [Allacma fusca]
MSNFVAIGAFPFDGLGLAYVKELAAIPLINFFPNFSRRELLQDIPVSKITVQFILQEVMLTTNIFILVALVSYSRCLHKAGEKLARSQDCDLSMEFHEKMYSYMENTKAFKNKSFEEVAAYMNDLCSWEAPRDIRNNFPYSHWGYDFDGRPVWYDEIGKQDFRRIVENGTYPVLERFFLQSMIPVVKSILAADKLDDEIRHGVFIWDMDGFSMKQFGHVPTAASVIRMARKYNDIPLELVGKAFLINANYVTKLAIDVARPLVGNLLDRVEVYGSNRNIWLPRLLKTFPIDIVPSWMGGHNDTRPLAIYG